ncbi:MULTISPECIES: IS4 family transposase [unclassified Moorena]|uniref:IS4 family transposase n=1 Tax=unclassified Moorena TaxID=2683338 RepID=UPI0013FF1C42|nr:MULTISPECIES: IS4 family transposase [unclassified Moorena]NEO17443.1 IS4 family transposase [Moorena sp. SIO3E8]NEQ04376.1 IS4 family transposase [Moorena sp. SIO3F7]
MLIQFYQTHFQSRLNPTHYITLQLLVGLLQFHKQVRIERLAALFPQPILFESRRRYLQRFLKLPKLSVVLLWFPIMEHLIKTYFSKYKRLYVALDRTQWKHYNLFVVSVIWSKRAWPIYWNFLDKRGCSNLAEQQALLRPAIRMLKGYDFVLLGDREFHSVELAKWLQSKNVAFALRQKADTYIQPKGQDFQQLNSLDLSPGMKKFITGVKVTKSQGFGPLTIACHWKRKYNSQNLDEPWYILTNLGSLKETLAAYKSRSGIEAMFKDCKSGGYNLEGSLASVERLTRLILLIAIAYTTAALQGLKIKQLGQQKYIGRLQELKRKFKRHSNFWVGSYGCISFL